MKNPGVSVIDDLRIAEDINDLEDTPTVVKPMFSPSKKMGYQGEVDINFGRPS